MSGAVWVRMNSQSNADLTSCTQPEAPIHFRRLKRSAHNLVSQKSEIGEEVYTGPGPSMPTIWNVKTTDEETHLKQTHGSVKL